MKIQATQPIRIPIQSIFRKDEILPLLGCDEETWEDMISGSRVQHLSLSTLANYLWTHGVNYEMIA